MSILRRCGDACVIHAGIRSVTGWWHLASWECIRLSGRSKCCIDIAGSRSGLLVRGAGVATKMTAVGFLPGRWLCRSCFKDRFYFRLENAFQAPIDDAINGGASEGWLNYCRARSSPRLASSPFLVLTQVLKRLQHGRKVSTTVFQNLVVFTFFGKMVRP